MKFFIYAPIYNENSGGSIVLHRLVHIINTNTEHVAYLVPFRLEKININSFKGFLYSIKSSLLYIIGAYSYKVNKKWATPTIKRIKKKDIINSIVVYPEITFGNPLNGKNIIRWFLHQPGYFKKEINYGVGELYFKFNSAIKHFELYGSKLSENELKVIHYPTEYYNQDGVISRSGTCYTIRKGKHKSQIHDDNAICIDGLNHQEIAEIFKRSECFISYDDYTAYSIFAVLCGCRSVVVPDENISIGDWYPDEKDRYGIAYGLSDEQIKWADETKSKVVKRVYDEHQRSIKSVIAFTEESVKYFKQSK